MNRTGLRHAVVPTPADVSVVLSAQAAIGEGPVWDARTKRLYWVDIVGQKLHVFDPSNQTNTTYDCPDIVTSVTPRAAGGLLLTLRRSFVLFDETTGRFETIAHVEPDMPGNRFNDGKTDRGGRHWAGTMGDVDWNHPIGNLYRFGPDHRPMRVVSGIRCSNGIAWSPDDRTMYLSGSAMSGSLRHVLRKCEVRSTKPKVRRTSKVEVRSWTYGARRATVPSASSPAARGKRGGRQGRRPERR